MPIDYPFSSHKRPACHNPPFTFFISRPFIWISAVKSYYVERKPPRWLAGQRRALHTCSFFFFFFFPDTSPHEPPLALNHRRKLFFSCKGLNPTLTIHSLCSNLIMTALSRFLHHLSLVFEEEVLGCKRGVQIQVKMSSTSNTRPVSEAVSLFISNEGQAYLLNCDLNKLNSLSNAP